MEYSSNLKNNVYAQLVSQSVAELKPLFTKDTIQDWNVHFNNIFATQESARRYINAHELYQMGVFEELFNEELRSLIYQLIPDAELYHCHAYETDGNQTKPHIHKNNRLAGWHRDYDCKHDFSLPSLQHISLFIYLTDVDKNSGAFEVSNKKLSLLPSIKSENNYSLLGDAGLTFLFDRKAFHRASPNQSTSSRRVLKLSFQRKTLFNHKQNEQAFIAVRDILTNDGSPLFLKQLFGISVDDKALNKEASQRYMQYQHFAKSPNNKLPQKLSLFQRLIAKFRDFKFIMNRLKANYIEKKDNITPTKADY